MMAVNTTVGTAAIVASAACVVAVVIAGIRAVRRVAVEVAPIALAAARSAPSVWREQGKQATQRAAMPTTTVAAAAARIAAGVAGGASCPAAWSGNIAVDVLVAVGNHSSARRRIHRRTNRTACWSAGGATTVIAFVATVSGAAATLAAARMIAEDGLIQTTAGAGCQHSRKQTEKQDPFHDFLPLLLQSTADYRQTLSSKQSEESRKSLESQLPAHIPQLIYIAHFHAFRPARSTSASGGADIPVCRGKSRHNWQTRMSAPPW